jgi:two-component system chemotaxis response regulator CheB
MIDVLIVDDSSVLREYLQAIFSADPDCRVIATVKNGEEAVRFVQRHKPDVIVMDVLMPQMNGFEATRQIMETAPVPIVVISGSSFPDAVQRAFYAMEAGAVAVEDKPHGLGHPKAEETAKCLVQTVKLMSQVKVVRRWSRRRQTADTRSLLPQETTPAVPRIQCVAVGASTGGPLVLQTLLAGLGTDFAVPVFIVQHIAAGFLPGLVEWLGQTTGFPARIAMHGEQAVAGRAYFAPDDWHMGVSNEARIMLSRTGLENRVRPAVSYLFRSIAYAYGAEAVGVLLTGMGQDGAQELKLMKERGAITIVQDRASAVVYGMPGVALQCNAATYVLSPQDMIATLLRVVQSPSPPPLGRALRRRT